MAESAAFGALVATVYEAPDGATCAKCGGPTEFLLEIALDEKDGEPPGFVGIGLCAVHVAAFLVEARDFPRRVVSQDEVKGYVGMDEVNG